MVKTNLIFMGAPGAGKGTVASILANQTNLVHLSTGNIFRNEIKNQTELGKQVEYYVNSGGYVPDSVTNNIVLNAINKFKAEGKYFILDGYPRTKEQAEFLNQQKDFSFKIIKLDVPNEVIIERLSGRRLCKKCGTSYHISFKPPKVSGLCDLDNQKLIIREDDKPDKINNRLKIYEEQTKPLLDFYQNQGHLINISATLSPDEVSQKVLELI